MDTQIDRKDVNTSILNPFEPDTSIQVGDRVRSYDFPGGVVFNSEKELAKERAVMSYVEGIVEEIGDYRGCLCYKIQVKRAYGEDREASGCVRPPVNGTFSTGVFGQTFGVVKVP